MLYLNLPDTAEIGGSYDVKINDEPKRVHWRDLNTMVIEPDDVRSIISMQSGDGLIAFLCSAAGKSADAYDIHAVPEAGGMEAVIIHEKKPYG